MFVSGPLFQRLDDHGVRESLDMFDKDPEPINERKNRPHPSTFESLDMFDKDPVPINERRNRPHPSTFESLDMFDKDPVPINERRNRRDPSIFGVNGPHEPRV